jgi:ABC-type multidrug transport system fused ATPase/permease subunit
MSFSLLLSGLFILLTALTIALATISSSRNLHNLLTSNILRLSVLFFDTNPLGRIMNRFSKDIDALDNLIPHTLRRYLIALSDTISILVVIAIATPIFVAFIIPIGVIYYFLQKLYISTSRQLKRLESIWRSPIYSHFSETLSGLPIIRATREQER